MPGTGASLHSSEIEIIASTLRRRLKATQLLGRVAGLISGVAQSDRSHSAAPLADLKLSVLGSFEICKSC